MAPKRTKTPSKPTTLGDRPKDTTHAPPKRLGPQRGGHVAGRAPPSLDRTPLMEGVEFDPKEAGDSAEGVPTPHRTKWWALESRGEVASHDNVARRLFFEGDAESARPPAWGDADSHESAPPMSLDGGVGAGDEAAVDGGVLRAEVASGGHYQEGDDGLEGRSSSSSSSYEYLVEDGQVVWWLPMVTNHEAPVVTERLIAEGRGELVVTISGEGLGPGLLGAGAPGERLVSTGSEARWVPRHQLERIGASHAEAARLLSHRTASPSPRCSMSGVWDWLTVEGLVTSAQSTLEVSRSALPHVVGRGGATIRELEDRLGVLIGVSDVGADRGSIGICGPPDRLPLARSIVMIVAQRFRSVLTRLPPVR